MVAFDVPDAVVRTVDIWVSYDVELVTPQLNENLVQGVTPLSANTTTAITEACGTAFGKGVTMNPTNATAGPLQKITAGLAGVPEMLYSLGGAYLKLKDGLDISRAKFRGYLNLIHHLYVTGVTPAAVLGTNILNFAVGVYDAVGTFLGTWNLLTSTYNTNGPRINSELSTASKDVRFTASGPLSELESMYPSARYLMPFINSGVAALGAGGEGFGWVMGAT